MKTIGAFAILLFVATARAQVSPPVLQDGSHSQMTVAESDFRRAAGELRSSFMAQVPAGSDELQPGTYELVTSVDLLASENSKDHFIRSRGRLLVEQPSANRFAFFAAEVIKTIGIRGDSGTFVLDGSKWSDFGGESPRDVDMRVVGDAIYHCQAGLNFVEISVWRRLASPSRSPRLDREIARQQRLRSR